MRLDLIIWAIESLSSRIRWRRSSELWRCSHESERWGTWLDTTRACKQLTDPAGGGFVFLGTEARTNADMDWILTLWTGTRHWPRECVSTGAAGAQTCRSLGHYLSHPLILRLLVTVYVVKDSTRHCRSRYDLISCLFLVWPYDLFWFWTLPTKFCGTVQ